MPKLWSDDAWEDYLWWQAEDKRTLKRINKLIEDALRNPYEGLGKPEKLKGSLSGLWSRRINEKDRLIYDVQGNTIRIYSARSHYSDLESSNQMQHLGVVNLVRCSVAQAFARPAVELIVHLQHPPFADIV